MTLINVVRMSSSSGAGSVTFDIHILPLMTGARKDSSCSLDIEAVLCDSNRRRSLTTSSVRRSHLVDVGDSPKECHSADLMRKGTLGERKRITSDGLCKPSMRTSINHKPQKFIPDSRLRDSLLPYTERSSKTADVIDIIRDTTYKR